MNRNEIDTSGAVGVRISREEVMGGGGAQARREWVLANGLGGFAMGSVDGRPDRRYHAWLIAASRPPVGRIVALHSCAEWVVVRERGGAGAGERDGAGGVERRFDLSTFRFAGGVVSPRGIDALAEFVRTGGASGACEWRYEIWMPGLLVSVVRRLGLSAGENAAVVSYRVGVRREGKAAGGEVSCVLEVRPFTPLRDFHRCERRMEDVYAVEPIVEGAAGGVAGCHVRRGEMRMSLRAEGAARFVREPQWWDRFAYERDEYRGQGEPEDLFSPGVFVLSCGEGETSSAIVAAFGPGGAEAGGACGAEKGEMARLRGVLGARVWATPGVPELAAASTQFLARRVGPGEGRGRAGLASAIIAGYPWFSDWGRDTCISLPGLMLTTGRHEEARAALGAMAALRKNGLIPNCFDDGSGHAEYNTADASLHFLRACCAYVRESGDRAGFERELLPACREIVAAYREGTDFSIRVDAADGLVCAGDATTQLTWMDARRDGVVFTPRHGKPVELSALWYSGLMELAEVVGRSEAGEAQRYREMADLAARHFSGAFWNERSGCLFDVLTPAWGRFVPDARIRPNQIFAASLPHSMLSAEQRALVLECVERHLLTPVGLRTLAPGEADYRGRYEGNLFERDRAYHNGTVWPWLMGPYAEAVLRAGDFREAARVRARAAVAPLLDRFARPLRYANEPLLQLSEVYDGDDAAEWPRRADGCPAQAWSVAELLRVVVLCEKGRG